MIGAFGDIVFEISEEKVFSLNNQIARIYKSKISEHQPLYGIGMLRHQGRELSEVNFSITLNSFLTKNLTEDKKKLIDMWEKGEYGNLVLAGQVFGEFPFLITEISEENSFFNREKGEFDIINLNISLKEYILNPKLYNQQMEAKKIKVKEQITEEETENIEIIQKTTKLQGIAEKINGTIEIAENKKKEILSYLEKIRKDTKIDEIMDVVRAGVITADKAKKIINHTKNFSETDKRIILNFLRNQIGGR
jgi:hypothetical protein|nr:MAG TPA: hypothetical protein [Caudoviricetes sp.]